MRGQMPNRDHTYVAVALSREPRPMPALVCLKSCKASSLAEAGAVSSGYVFATRDCIWRHWISRPPHCPPSARCQSRRSDRLAASRYRREFAQAVDHSVSLEPLDCWFVHARAERVRKARQTLACRFPAAWLELRMEFHVSHRALREAPDSARLSEAGCASGLRECEHARRATPNLQIAGLRCRMP